MMTYPEMLTHTEANVQALLNEDEILALKNEAALLVHNQLRDSVSPTRIKRSALITVLEHFISEATGRQPKFSRDAIDRHSDFASGLQASKTVW